jgi:hypothetical protein
MRLKSPVICPKQSVEAVIEKFEIVASYEIFVGIDERQRVWYRLFHSASRISKRRHTNIAFSGRRHSPPNTDQRTSPWTLAWTCLSPPPLM